MMVAFKYATIQMVLLLAIAGTRVVTYAEINSPIGTLPAMSYNQQSKQTENLPITPFVSQDQNIIKKARTIPFLRGPQLLETVLSIRGGKIVKKSLRPSVSNSIASSEQKLAKIKKGMLLTSISIIIYGLFRTQETWLALFDKEKLQASVVQTLENLNDLPFLYSRSFYTIAMALWETLGMSTIPVETAAGMVFGRSAFYWSGLGKVMGACLAFGLGRGALSGMVDAKLSSNTFLNLVQSQTKDNPLLVTVLIKLSCFPETVKNFGSSMLKPIQWWMFVSATLVHGLTFTALWTYLGVDTAARLKDTAGLLPPDQLLKTLLSLALINGIVVSPLAMAYWIRALKQKQQTSQKSTKKIKK